MNKGLGVLRRGMFRSAFLGPSQSSIWLSVIIGLAAREIFAPFTGHPFDFELWIHLGYYVSKGYDPYTVTNPIPGLSFPGAKPIQSIGYPPLWAFFQAGLYTIYSVAGINNRFVYYFIVKQPMILGDLLSAYLLFTIIMKETNDRKKAINALRFWLLCPYTILNSAIWGMFDQIILDLLLFSIILVTATEKSAFIESLGILLKAIPLIFLPVLALSQKTLFRIVQYLAISIGVSVLLTILPYLFFPSWNISNLLGTGASVTNKIANSINYWVIVYALNNLHVSLASVFAPLKALAYLWIPAVLIASIFCWRSLLKGGLTRRKLIFSCLFVLMVFFLTRSNVNEQYVIYFLGLGLFDVYVLQNERKKLFHLVWISALLFLTANNSYYTRFFEPLSITFLNLDRFFYTGLIGDIRIIIEVPAGIAFTVVCLYYLRSMYRDISSSLHDRESSSGLLRAGFDK